MYFFELKDNTALDDSGIYTIMYIHIVKIISKYMYFCTFQFIFIYAKSTF